MKQKSFLGLAPFVCAATTAALGCGASHGEDWARDGGGLHNDAGQLVNDAGQTINDAGQVINDAGQVINDAGQPIDTGTPGNEDSGAGGSTDSGGTGTVDSGGGPTGAAITCSNPGTYTMNGGACGTERWDIKTGTDPYTGMVSLVPQPNTIATLAGLPAAGGGTMRESPTEVTLWDLKDVTLT